MTRILLLLLCVFFTNIAVGQDKEFPSSTPEKINFTKYPLPKRLSLFPFSKATHVKLVSFPEQKDTANKRGEPEYGLPILNDTICFQKIDQIKALTLSQIDTLTDILYNTCHRWTIYEYSQAACYLPHNAIIFYDKDDKPFEYIEICFDCHGLEFSSPKIEKFELCDYTYTDLKKFFKSLGLKTGVDEFQVLPGSK